MKIRRIIILEYQFSHFSIQYQLMPLPSISPRMQQSHNKNVKFKWSYQNYNCMSSSKLLSGILDHYENNGTNCVLKFLTVQCVRTLNGILLSMITV